MALKLFLLLFISLLGANGGMGRIITLKNQCKITIWPGILPVIDRHVSNLPLLAHDYELRSGEAINITAPKVWEATIWGRTRCSFGKSNSNGTCVIGSCGRKLRCSSNASQPPLPPYTSAQISLNPVVDSYVISLVNGFNVPMSILPYGTHDGSKQSCRSSSCLSDVNKICPNVRRVRFNNGTVGCKGDCQEFNNHDCCSRDKCLASSAFKAACPTAAVSRYDLQQSMFWCPFANYLISFC